MADQAYQQGPFAYGLDPNMKERPAYMPAPPPWSGRPRAGTPLEDIPEKPESESGFRDTLRRIRPGYPAAVEPMPAFSGTYPGARTDQDI